MVENIFSAIYEEYLKSEKYKQLAIHEEAIHTMDNFIQSSEVEGNKNLNELEENYSRVTGTAEMQGFYNGFKCALLFFTNL